MNKQSLFTILLTVLMSMTGSKAFAHDIEVANDDGVTIYYKWANNNTELSVSSRGSYYSSNYSGNVVIPESVVYNGKTYSVTSIGDYAFYYCMGLTSVTIPNNVTSIGDHAFYDCSGLTLVTIPNSVTFIDNYAFSGCRGLTSIVVDSGNQNYDSRNNCNAIIESSSNTLILGCKNTIIPNSVTSIGDYAFYGCSGLTSVTIPNSVTSIGDDAFLYCSGLTSVVIGSGVTSIGGSAFSGTNLKKTIWLTNTPPSGYSNASGAVNYVSNDKFTSLSNRLQYQFLSSYFDVDGVRYVLVSPSERTCDAIDCVYDESSADMKIASTVTYKGVTMTVKGINPYLAHNNKFIKTLKIDNDGEIANFAFTDCSNMKSIILGNKVSAIGSNAFQGCSSLEAIDIPDIVTVLNDYIFYDCAALAAITIPAAVTKINNYVFSGCTSLKEVNIADSDTELTLGSNASSPIFSSCPLETVYIGRNINYYYSPFYRNTSLKTISITDKETEISDNEFYGCTNLQSITIGDGVTTIGNYAFSGCSSLKYFTFGSQVQTIGEEAFSDCSAIVEVISKAQNPPVCGSQALDDINKFECKLYVPDGYKAVYEEADQWKDFFFKEEGEGTGGQSGGINYGKCEAPTITLTENKLSFSCPTEEAVIHYNISTPDVQNGVGSEEVSLTNTYTVSVYATKEGFENSNVTTREIVTSGNGETIVVGDVNKDGKVDVADHVELTNIIMNQK